MKQGCCAKKWFLVFAKQFELLLMNCWNIFQVAINITIVLQRYYRWSGLEWLQCGYNKRVLQILTKQVIYLIYNTINLIGYS